VVIRALLSSLRQKTPLSTELLSTEIKNTMPLSRARADEIDAIRHMGQTQFVPVA